MSEEIFIEALKELGFNLTEYQKELFKKYATFLLDYNLHTNLTAIKSVDEVYLKHFYDSILVLKYYKIYGRILDIGCGAGFPGVPLKILIPEIDLYLLDSNGKKTEFLEKLKKELNIEYHVINSRAEKYIEGNREGFDFVISRAVASLPILSELSIPFVKIGGKFIAYKGQYQEELEASKYAINELGGVLELVANTTLYERSDVRSFIVIAKKCKTDIKYPRLFEKISKKPLQK